MTPWNFVRKHFYCWSVYVYLFLDEYGLHCPKYMRFPSMQKGLMSCMVCKHGINIKKNGCLQVNTKVKKIRSLGCEKMFILLKNLLPQILLWNKIVQIFFQVCLSVYYWKQIFFNLSITYCETLDLKKFMQKEWASTKIW